MIVMNRWAINARAFASRGGLPCPVMRVPLAPRVVAPTHIVPTIQGDHFVRDVLLVPLIHNSKHLNRFVEFSPFRT
jgi:hypothetical protein